MRNKFGEGMVRVSPILGMFDVLESSGLDAEGVLRITGTDSSVFDEPDNLLSAQARAHLMQVCSEATGWQHFGLLVGSRANLSAFGLVGYLAMHSDSVEQALQSLFHYLHLHGQGAAGELSKEGDRTFIGYEIYQPIADGRDQVEDAALAIMYNTMVQLCGRDWGPEEVWFTHSKPDHVQPYKQLFRAPLRFNMARSGLFFPARWLHQQVRTADPELHRLLQKQIDELESRYTEDFPEQVRRIMHHSMLAGHVDAAEVATLFSIHSRTLHRRLKLHGITFKQLRDECRYSVACHMLESSGADLCQIADMLGYSDARSFSRAFKRWSGMSPSSWREQRREPSRRAH